MADGRPGLIHKVRAKTNAFLYAHIVFAVIALVGSWAVIRSQPRLTVTTILLFFAFLFLLVVFEGYTEKRVLPTGLLDAIAVISLVIFVAGISVAVTFVVAGHSPGEIPQTPQAQTPPPIQPAPPPVPTAPPPAPSPLPMRLKIASVYQEAGGCQATGQNFAVAIPNSDRLDIGFSGPVAGIEFVPTTKNGDSGVRNIAFGAGTVTFQLFAGGGGTVQHIPWPIDKDECIGASGGSIGEEIYAHYK